MLRRSVLAGAGAIGLLGSSAARANTLDDVKKSGKLAVGTEAAYVPYEFFKDGAIVGYDPDIAAAILGPISVKANFIDTDWSGIIPALYAKKFDCIISGMTITKERAEKVLFTMPYADASNVLMVRADETRIKTPEDLSGMTVGVTLGSAGDVVAKRFEEKLKSQGKPGYREIKRYAHYPEAYQDLINKRLDGVINSKSTMMVVLKDAPGKFKLMPGVQDITAYFGMAFRKEDADMRDFFNAGLAKMKADGSLAKLQTKWFGDMMETPNSIPEVLP